MTPSLAAVAILLTASPLPLPGNFDPEVNLPAKTTENGTFHESRGGASLAHRLVANGTPEDIALAEKVLEAVFACQELRPDESQYGNYYWMYEDDRVQDKNAVEFILKELIPMMLQYQDRLDPELRERTLASIRLGLANIRAIDVTLTYTNIAVYDIVNTILGGELLDDAAIAQRGYDKLRAWEVFTNMNGSHSEYNSPTYSSIAIEALGRLAHFTRNDEARIRARVMGARMALGVGLRMHRATGRWAGPHSRAYQPTVDCSRGAEIGRVGRWVQSGAAPPWFTHVLEGPSLPYEVRETAHRDLGIEVSTYMAPSFALGVGTRRYFMHGRQSNLFIMHYDRPGAERPGVVYARYLTNDKWLGDWYHATDRTSSRNLLDEGMFYGVQSGSRAIGVYTSGVIGKCTSAKGALIWTQRERVDEIWVGDQRVDSLPAPVPEGEVVVAASGTALLAVAPLTPTDLGGAVVRLAERQGDLVLEMVNYEGPQTRISPAKDRHRCGFYAEAAERPEYPDARAFGRLVAGGKLRDKVGRWGKRLWTVEYKREGIRLGLKVDPADWTLEKRWDEDGEQGWPMLESPAACQNATGRVTVGKATLACGKHPAWLFADDASRTWVAGYHGEPAPLTLSVPGGSVHVQAMGTGMVAWEDGKVHVEAVGLRGEPVVTGDTLAE